jgi:hypothetical protein
MNFCFKDHILIMIIKLYINLFFNKNIIVYILYVQKIKKSFDFSKNKTTVVKNLDSD